MCFIYRVIAKLKLNQKTLEFPAKDIKTNKNPHSIKKKRKK